MVGATPNIATRQPPQSAARVGAVPASSASGSTEPEAWTAHATVRRRENFIVMSPLLPRRLRPGFAAVYAFCRTADDLADEQGATPADRERALALLASFRRSLHACFACNPREPLFIDLAATIRQHNLPIEPFERLLDAFEQDQHVARYETWDQLVDYSTRSADPVGRLVLMLAGCDVDPVERSSELARKSDAICTALQLVNFWQDVRRDLIERDRVYLPANDTGLTAEWLRTNLDTPSPDARAQYREALQPLVAKARDLIAEGQDLPRLVPKDIAAPIWLFVEAARRTAAAIERANYQTLWQRPTVRTPARLAMLAGATRVRLAGAGRSSTTASVRSQGAPHA